MSAKTSRNYILYDTYVLITHAAAPYITGTSPLNSTSFTVNWTTSDPSYNINYTVIWTNLNTSVVDSFTVPENTSSYTVTGLNGIHNYNVSVRANNNTGGTNTSDSVTVYGKNLVECLKCQCKV